MSLRILVVEDDDAARYAMVRILTDKGFDVQQAPDYREALRVVEDGASVGLLITDLILPSVNGFALARMARMRHHNLKVIYVTAYDDIPTSEAVGPIIRKPIEAETLLMVVQNALQVA
jgi:two-component system cell cycle sensor histidine kinase/response regulator CckA